MTIQQIKVKELLQEMSQLSKKEIDDHYSEVGIIILMGSLDVSGESFEMVKSDGSCFGSALINIHLVEMLIDTFPDIAKKKILYELVKKYRHLI